MLVRHRMPVVELAIAGIVSRFVLVVAPRTRVQSDPSIVVGHVGNSYAIMVPRGAQVLGHPFLRTNLDGGVRVTVDVGHTSIVQIGVQLRFRQRLLRYHLKANAIASQFAVLQHHPEDTLACTSNDVIAHITAAI